MPSLTDRSSVTGQDLRVARERAGLSRARLAGLAGCSPASVQNLEAGYAPKRSQVMERVQAALAEVERSAA
jgi:transcriptional regulator with XRE-family HTH domain